MKRYWLWLAVVTCFCLSRGFGQPPTPESESAPSLSSIKEFQKRVTFPPKTVACSSIYRFLSRKSGLKLSAKEIEFQRNEILIGYQDQPIHAVMDALAAMFLAQWQLDKDTYYLITGPHILDKIYGLGDDNKRSRIEAGREFIRAIESAPDKDNYFSPEGTSFANFSPALQDNIRQMATAVRNQSPRNIGIGEHLAKLDESTVTLRRSTTITGAVEYWVNIQNSSGGSGFRIHNYGDPMNRNGSPGASGNEGNLVEQPLKYYPTKKFEISLKEAKANHPMLHKTVSLNLKGYTFPLVMKHLHQEYGVPFISDLPKHMPQKANVSIGPVPLGEALDYLTLVYKDTEWELRKSGFVVVRGPTHPGRDGYRSPNQNSGTPFRTPNPAP